MAIAEVQQKSSLVSPGNTSHAHGVDSTPTNNNLLVCVMLFSSDPGTITKPSGWDSAVQQQRGTGHMIVIHYKVAASEGTSWTWSTTNSVLSQAEIYEYSGLNQTQASVLDKTASTDGGASNVTSLSSGTTATTTQADELLVAGVTLNGASGGSFGWTSSFTDDGGSNLRVGSAVRIVAATGAYATTGSWTTARLAVAAIATFKAAAGTQASAGSAAGTGAANAATTKVSPTVGTAASTGTANAPSVVTGIVVNAGTAASTGTAYGPSAGVAPTAGSASAEGQAQGPIVNVPLVHAAERTTAELLELDGIRHRVEAIRFDLLDASENKIGELAVDRGRPATVENRIANLIHRTLTGLWITPTDLGAVNTITDRVQPRWVLSNGDELSLGIFLFASADRHVNSYGSWTPANLGDKCMILAQALRATVAYPAGYAVYTAILDQLAQAGIASPIVEFSPASFSAPVVWVPGRDTRMKVLQDMAALGGYLEPYFDNDGVFRMRAAGDPADLPAEFTYGSDTRIVAGTIVDSDDLLQAPNVYIVVDSGAGNTPIVGSYEIPAEAPHSYANRGYYVTRTITAQGIPDQLAANAMALAAYTKDPQAYRWVTFDSTPDPRHDTHNVIAYNGLNYREVAWRLPCTAGGHMQHSLRRAY